MIGTIVRLKQSRISKICAFILSLVVGLSSFLLLSPTVYAAVSHTEYSYNNFSAQTSYSVSPFIPTAVYDYQWSTSNNTVEDGYIGWYDVDVKAVYQWEGNPTLNYNQYFNGYFQVNFNVLGSLTNVNNDVYTYKLGLIDYSSSGIGSALIYNVNEQAYSSSSPEDRSLYTTCLIYYENERLNSNFVRTDVSLHLRYYVYSPRFAGTSYPTGTIPSITVSAHNTNSYFRFWGYDSEVNFLSEMQSSLNTINTNLVSMYNSINSAAVQAHSDAVQAHNDSTAINNNILHDSSGSSQNSASVQASYEAANQAADTAIDGAVHNYDNQLAEVENVNFDNFFTSQNAAVTFWRDVGEFVLNSSNLGYIASGMIIVTLIGLFVFLLRL